MSDGRRVAGVIYSSRLFKYNPETKTFTSDLANTPAILRQLWDDDLVLGFGIRSAKTGNVVFFTLSKIHGTEPPYDGWEFVDSSDIGLHAIVYR